MGWTEEEGQQGQNRTVRVQIEVNMVYSHEMCTHFYIHFSLTQLVKFSGFNQHFGCSFLNHVKAFPPSCTSCAALESC